MRRQQQRKDDGIEKSSKYRGADISLMSVKECSAKAAHGDSRVCRKRCQKGALFCVGSVGVCCVWFLTDLCTMANVCAGIPFSFSLMLQ
eukprot:COSAG06_NODE_2312_length_7100_cov_7.782609_6_plen_89_part_00